MTTDKTELRHLSPDEKDALLFDSVKHPEGCECRVCKLAAAIIQQSADEQSEKLFAFVRKMRGLSADVSLQLSDVTREEFAEWRRKW